MDRFKRTWVVVVLATVLVVSIGLIVGCGGGTTTTTAGPAGETTTTAAAEQAVAGGTLNFYINEPAFIDPVNLQESEGTQVGNAVFDSLVAFDPKTSKLVPAAAEKWEPNADASVWTFHLRQGAKFHDGTDVKAGDFKYAWERICNPANKSEISYHLAPVKGYDEMQKGTVTELSGVKVVDDYTLEVTLNYPFGDFEYVVGHSALAPVPKAAVEKDPKAFADMPIGNGPFKMAEPWKHDQYVKVVRFEDYYGDKALLDGVDFKIFKDEETAMLEFRAGNVDFTTIPSGQVNATKAEFGESSDGLEVFPGKQTLLGPETAVYYILMNNEDPILKNADVRRAFSLAINRQAIADTVYEGVRTPATGIIPEGMVGWQKDAWAYSKYDVAQAKTLLEKAGYPGGKGIPEILLSFNTGAGHEDVMALIQSDLKAIGVSAKFDGSEWAQYLDKLDAKKYQMGRLGWIADYPIMDNFLFPLFTTGAGDNKEFYTNPAVDTAIQDARKIVDSTARIAAYQAIEKTIGEDAPVIPIVTYRHHHVGSERIRGFVLSPGYLAALDKAWIAPGK